MDLYQLSLIEAISGIKARKFSRMNLVSSVLERINKIDGDLSAFISLNPEATKEASLLDQKNDDSCLSGIPFAVKEVLSTKGIQTTASSKILEGYIPVFDATVVKRLKENGAIIIGKTNCDSFAEGASTENSGFGPSKNPWDTSRVPGGSSGGSATAVSADECIFSLGTDTGGSIRQPSSFCNVSGLKPTYGACSRYGLLAMASSFDCPGPIAKTVEDCEVIFNLMKGKDEHDSTTREGEITRKKGKLTIGLPKEYFSEGIDGGIKQLVYEASRVLEKNGFQLKEVSLPNTKYAISVYYVLVPSEVSSNMARYDGVRYGNNRDVLEEEVKRRIMIGTYALSTGYIDKYYNKANKIRELIQEDFDKVFSEVDVLLGPVSPTAAFKIGEKTTDPVKMYLEDVLSVSANLAGIPGLALPCGFTKNNLPVGMQILGPAFSEGILFEIGKKFQQLSNWHTRKPPILSDIGH